MESNLLIFFFLIIVPSAIIHEYCHGWMADYLGDPTAKQAGRLTLNPAAHIDLMGTIFLPLFLFFFSSGKFLFAYAKPVPFNPYNLRYQRWGPALVAVAGPLANLAVAAVFGILVRLLPHWSGTFILFLIIYANILLAIFNLLPISPLDGSKILYAITPLSWGKFDAFMERYGLIILLLFLFFGFHLLMPIVHWLFALVSGLPLSI